MSSRQFEYAYKILGGLYDNGFIEKRDWWEMEGAIIDIYNGDGLEFYNTLTLFGKVLTKQILETVGYLI